MSDLVYFSPVSYLSDGKTEKQTAAEGRFITSLPTKCNVPWVYLKEPWQNI